MPFPSYKPSELHAIHLCRALLREASYLPDSQARRYFLRHILDRFKAYQPASHRNGSIGTRDVETYKRSAYKRRKNGIIRERAPQQLKVGTRALNYLRRANNFEFAVLDKVLMLAYGRLGRRKYALLDGLLKPEDAATERPTGDEDKRSPLQQAYYSDKQYLAFFEAPKVNSQGMVEIRFSKRYRKLREVLESQRRAGQARNASLKSSHITFPAKNIWQRDMPIKRARNNVKRWVSDAFDKILPPLPEAEWTRLRDLVNGKIKCEPPIPRRAPGTLRDVSGNGTVADGMRSSPQLDSHWDKFVQDGGIWRLKKTTIAERPRGRKMIGRPHTWTPRFMRHTYGRLFSRCCMLTWNETHNKWLAQWGHAPSPVRPPVDPTLFAGVDMRGKRPPKMQNKEPA